jgi:hypothetical protein
VQDALLDVVRFWLRRGVDGFRLDTINFYFADRYLRDNPPLPRELRNDSIAPSVNPYNHQLHLFSKNQPENLDFLRRFRAELVPYGAAAVGRGRRRQRGLEIMASTPRAGTRCRCAIPSSSSSLPVPPRRSSPPPSTAWPAPHPTLGLAGATRTTTPCATSPAGACPTRPPAPTLPS